MPRDINDPSNSRQETIPKVTEIAFAIAPGYALDVEAFRDGSASKQLTIIYREFNENRVEAGRIANTGNFIVAASESPYTLIIRTYAMGQFNRLHPDDTVGRIQVGANLQLRWDDAGGDGDFNDVVTHITMFPVQ